MFVPVLAGGVLYIAGLKLTGFIVFQLFIEMFVLWHFAIGLNLWYTEENSMQKKLFVINMLFALVYRMSGNIYQAVYYYHHAVFPDMEKFLWIIPVHLYASIGSVYCFYQNARWITLAEKNNGINPGMSIRQTFFRLLAFPWGLWNIQPRLNRLAAMQKL